MCTQKPEKEEMPQKDAAAPSSAMVISRRWALVEAGCLCWRKVSLTPRVLPTASAHSYIHSPGFMDLTRTNVGDASPWLVGSVSGSI
ncbi:unnamed protein product [Ceratitis capitata]|uniref:(Mediterranean fruit fly) hypothetical protein n=1 Tax=Ceratitis capitata TaxID=7213 RepID=A0A811ULW0_CERCA|nr:unnamed protein product [Ceratitis capitata]CAD6998089.1 unnamed protein product [Ceratitis capitata]